MKSPVRNLICILGLFAGSSLLAAEIEPPVPVRTVTPDYPADMRNSHTSGMVTVSCEIDDKGVVIDPKVAKTTNEAFNQAAVDAVAKWKFRPAQKDGKPISTHVNLPVKFTTED